MTTHWSGDGWWEQDLYGRQPMESLSLAFSNHQLNGAGVDMIGPFTLIGSIDDRSQCVAHLQTLAMSRTLSPFAPRM